MITLSNKSALKLCGVVMASAVLGPSATQATLNSGGPFAGLSGHWLGTGTVTMMDGSKKRLLCNSANAVNSNGRSITQNLRCTSGVLKLDIRSNVFSEGGLISGSWTEATHRVWGSVYGHANRSAIVADVGGTGFAAHMNVRMKGNKQSVTMESFTLEPERGTDIADIAVALRK
ncbi:MAG: hypothetical protein J2P49_02295 [Methylocapsa sp.]|nr:hypothetical protein [Methylocapsa sp.]